MTVMGAGEILAAARDAGRAPAADVIGAGNAIVTKVPAPSVSPARGACVGAAAKAVKTSLVLAYK